MAKNHEMSVHFPTNAILAFMSHTAITSKFKMCWFLTTLLSWDVINRSKFTISYA